VSGTKVADFARQVLAQTGLSLPHSEPHQKRDRGPQNRSRFLFLILNFLFLILNKKPFFEEIRLFLVLEGQHLSTWFERLSRSKKKFKGPFSTKRVASKV
jgi:hypothetical protein